MSKDKFSYNGYSKGKVDRILNKTYSEVLVNLDKISILLSNNKKGGNKDATGVRKVCEQAKK